MAQVEVEVTTTAGNTYQKKTDSIGRTYYAGPDGRVSRRAFAAAKANRVKGKTVDEFVTTGGKKYERRLDKNGNEYHVGPDGRLKRSQYKRIKSGWGSPRFDRPGPAEKFNKFKKAGFNDVDQFVGVSLPLRTGSIQRQKNRFFGFWQAKREEYESKEDALADFSRMISQFEQADTRKQQIQVERRFGVEDS